MEVTRRIQVRNRASSCRPGLGLALLARAQDGRERLGSRGDR